MKIALLVLSNLQFFFITRISGVYQKCLKINADPLLNRVIPLGNRNLKENDIVSFLIFHISYVSLKFNVYWTLHCKLYFSGALALGTNYVLLAISCPHFCKIFIIKFKNKNLIKKRFCYCPFTDINISNSWVFCIKLRMEQGM